MRYKEGKTRNLVNVRHLLQLVNCSAGSQFIVIVYRAIFLVIRFGSCWGISCLDLFICFFFLWSCVCVCVLLHVCSRQMCCPPISWHRWWLHWASSHFPVIVHPANQLPCVLSSRNHHSSGSKSSVRHSGRMDVESDESERWEDFFGMLCAPLHSFSKLECNSSWCTEDCIIATHTQQRSSIDLWSTKKLNSLVFSPLLAQPLEM